MARQRRKPSTKGNTSTTAVAVTSTPTNVSTKQGERKMAGLSPEQIAALLGSTRQKGIYIKYLNEFVESGEGGVCVNEQWVDLAEKKATTLKQGFENAKDNKEAGEGAQFVKVIVNEDKVFLINLKQAGVAADDGETEDEA